MWKWAIWVIFYLLCIGLYGFSFVCLINGRNCDIIFPYFCSNVWIGNDCGRNYCSHTTLLWIGRRKWKEYLENLLQAWVFSFRRFISLDGWVFVLLLSYFSCLSYLPFCGEIVAFGELWFLCLMFNSFPANRVEPKVLLLHCFLILIKRSSVVLVEHIKCINGK